MKKKKIFISITGMSGAGKTTLVNSLRNYYNKKSERGTPLKIAFMEEGARDILKNDLPNLDLSKYLTTPFNQLTDVDRAKYEVWQAKLCENFNNKLDQVGDVDIIISDRSPVDQLVYYLIQYGDKTSQMYDNITTMISAIATAYSNWMIFLDTPIDQVMSNMKTDSGHHYTEDLFNLLQEKSMFLQVIKELDFLDTIMIMNGNSPDKLLRVIDLIKENLGDSSKS